MITITTQLKFEALLAAVLLKRILMSNAAKIVLESDLNSSKLSLDISSYSLEHLLHEYERKFDKIDIIHNCPNGWTSIKEIIERYIKESSHEISIQAVVEDLELIIQKNTPEALKRNIQNFQKKFQTKKPLQYGLSLLPLQFAAR